jgi:hypothetical protein
MLNLTQFPIITLSKTINVLIPANIPAGTSIYLPYDAEINVSVLRGIKVSKAGYDVSLSINGVNVIDEDDIKSLYISFANQNEQKIIDDFPLNALTSLSAQNNRAIRRFNCKIDLAKSAIRLNTALSASPTVDNYVPITFYYKPLNWI